MRRIGKNLSWVNLRVVRGVIALPYPEMLKVGTLEGYLRLLRWIEASDR